MRPRKPVADEVLVSGPHGSQDLAEWHAGVLNRMAVRGVTYFAARFNRGSWAVYARTTS